MELPSVTRATPALVIALWLLPAGAFADWLPAGTPICSPDCRPDSPRAVSDAGGFAVAWRDSRSYPESGLDVYLQRVSASGDIAPEWPVGGVRIGRSIYDESTWAVVGDGLGGYLVLWQTQNPGTGADLYVQRVAADGTHPPGWPPEGVAVVVAPEIQSVPAIAPDGAGGAYLAWEDQRNVPGATGFDIYAQHILADGTIAPGWFANGIPVCDSPGPQGGQISAIPDDVGGVLVIWADLRRGPVDIYAQRVLADGSVAPGWVDDGMPVVMNLAVPELARDGAGGFYVGGSTLLNGYSQDYRVQRFTFGGTVSPGWPVEGLMVCDAPDDRGNLAVASDELGGLLMVWADFRLGPLELFATRVLANGTVAPGWQVNGEQVSGTSGRTDHNSESSIAPDGAGGMYLAWEWKVTGNAVVQHLTMTGDVAEGWPPGGAEVAPGRFSQPIPQVVTDGAGGAIVVWDQNSVEPSQRGLFAKLYRRDAPVAAQLSLVRAEAGPDRVDLLWQGAGAGVLAAVVERRTPSGDWQTLGPTTSDGPDRLRYEDRAVEPGRRYGYRLAWREDGVPRNTDEAWVDVPAALQLALEGFRPNPASAGAAISFTLPTAGPARLEVLDIAGRRVFSREVGAMGPGRHQVRVGGGPGLSPGVYVIRLTGAGATLTSRGVVTQ